MVISVKKVKQEQLELKKDYWERLRRNPKYIKDYSEMQSMKREEFLDRWPTFCGEYHLVEPINPDKEFEPALEKLIEIASGFINIPNNLDGNMVPHPIERWSFVEKSVPHFDGVMRKIVLRSHIKPKDFCLYKGKYLNVLINIELADKQVRQIASDAVNLAKEFFFVKDGRARIEDNALSYKVWDLRKLKMSYAAIGAKLFPKQNWKRASTRIRKSFLRAYELIFGKKYDPKNRKRIEKDELAKFCGNCTDKSCLHSLKRGNNWLPCPSIAEYIEQDQVSQQEFIMKEPSGD